MSEGLNKVQLLGNVGADPELRTTSGGQAVLKLRLATSESYLDASKNRQERTEWHSVVFCGKRGESLGRILHKGDRVFIEGGIRTSSYDDKDGQKRYKTEIVAQNVILCGGGQRAERQAQPAQASAPADYQGGNSGNAPDDDFPF